MLRVIRSLVKVAAFGVVMWLVGRTVSRQVEGGTTPDDDEFRVMSLIGGRQITSRAARLRSAHITVVAGGVDLDLTNAHLDDSGAHLTLDVTAGGIRVAVPESWRVFVAEQVMMGGIEVDLTDPATLSDEAPTLTVEAVIRGGGVLLETSESQRESRPSASA